MQRRGSRRGFILIQNMIAFIITLFFIPLVTTSFRVIMKHDFISEIAQDEIALYQLRRILILSENIDITTDKLLFEYNRESNEMVINNGHSYIRPGTQIILNNIEDGYFTSEDHLIWINYLRDDKWFKRVLINV